MTIPSDINTIVFIAGLGAPVEIYSDLIENLRQQFPHVVLHTVEWWSQDDFGKNELNRYLKNTNAMLVGHSAGGSVAIQALVNSPTAVRRVVMLDSHTLKGMSPFPPVETFLDILLSGDSAELNDKVRTAYVPVLKDNTAFYRALDFIAKWVKNGLHEDLSTIKTMPEHRALHMGFTDSRYQVLDTEHESELKNFWGQYNIDTQFFPMSHFELIEPSRAKSIVQKISKWLS